MKILKPLFLYLFFSIPFFSFSQTKISIETGLLAAQIEGTMQYTRTKNRQPKVGYKHYRPYIGFSYERHFNEHFFLSGNANYTTFNIPFFVQSLDIDPFYLKYNHISISALLNFELYSHKKNEKQVWNLFFGAGANVNHFRNFRVSSISFLTDNLLGREANGQELGIIYNIAFKYKNFKIGFNHALGQKTSEAKRANYIQSSNWYSISTSYVFILND